jgi:hypothetical protein
MKCCKALSCPLLLSIECPFVGNRNDVKYPNLSSHLSTESKEVVMKRMQETETVMKNLLNNKMNTMTDILGALCYPIGLSP